MPAFPMEGSDSRHSLETNPIFQQALQTSDLSRTSTPFSQLPHNVITLDGQGRLLTISLQNREQLCYVNLSRSDYVCASAELVTSSINGQPFQTINLSLPVDTVLNLKTSRNGQYLALAGETYLAVVDLMQEQTGHSAQKKAGQKNCSIVRVGKDLFMPAEKGGRTILQLAWHPGSDTHLGVLTSDGAFRLFDLSQDYDTAEQEYFLHRSPAAGLSHPVDFAFGGDHLWERFTVFFLFNDGTIHALCPVVPFGSRVFQGSVQELLKDVQHWGAQGEQQHPATADIATAWLEAVFPGLSHPHKRPATATTTATATALLVSAKAYLPVDCSPSLQGPFPVIGEDDSTASKQRTQASSLLCCAAGRDSVLAWASTDGTIRIHALDGEVQPAWSFGVAPHRMLDDEGHLLSAIMVAEEASQAAPPLVLLALVDLDLPRSLQTAARLLGDPLVPSRLYCSHGGGVDAIVLRWLPSTDLPPTSNGGQPVQSPPPDVICLLDIRGNASAAQALLGLVTYADSLGDVWLISVTSQGQCTTVPVQFHSPPIVPPLAGPSGTPSTPAYKPSQFEVLSRELVQGPRNIPMPRVASPGGPLTSGTHEGRLFFHDRCKLLHEKYVEYAHRVHVELTERVTQLTEIVDQEEMMVKELQRAIAQEKDRAVAMAEKIAAAFECQEELEGRLQRYSKLPGISKRPLTSAEKELSRELAALDQELPLLQSTVGGLAERVKRLVNGNQAAEGASLARGQARAEPKSVPDTQMRRVKAAVEQSADLITDMMQKVKILGDDVAHKERLQGR